MACLSTSWIAFVLYIFITSSKQYFDPSIEERTPETRRFGGYSSNLTPSLENSIESLKYKESLASKIKTAKRLVPPSSEEEPKQKRKRRLTKVEKFNASSYRLKKHLGQETLEIAPKIWEDVKSKETNDMMQHLSKRTRLMKANPLEKDKEILGVHNLNADGTSSQTDAVSHGTASAENTIAINAFNKFMKTPRMVNDFKYYDSDNPLYVGSHEPIILNDGKKQTYFDPLHGIMGDKVDCAAIKDPEKCTSEKTCGWCSEKLTCISGSREKFEEQCYSAYFSWDSMSAPHPLIEKGKRGVFFEKFFEKHSFMKKPDPFYKTQPNDGNDGEIIINFGVREDMGETYQGRQEGTHHNRPKLNLNTQNSSKIDTPRIKASDTVALDEDSIFGKRNVNVASSIKVNHELKKIKNKSPEEKLAFIRKVFFIVTMQFLLTLIIVLASFRSEPFRKFQKEKIAILVASVIVIVVIAALLILKQDLARHTPNNYILLFIFTLSKGYFVSYMCSEISQEIVLTSAAMAEGVLVALTIYALIVKNDIAYKGGLMFVTIVMFILFGILMKTTKQNWWTIFLIGFALLFFAIFLIYDMHSVARGSSRHDFDSGDYVVASLCVYVDIVLIFTYLATIISSLFKSLDNQ